MIEAKFTAWHMARSGRRSALVGRRWIGGFCPNVACLPSKDGIRSAEIAHMARNTAQFGTMTGPVKVDMAKVRQRKCDIVQALVDAHLRNYKTSGAELITDDGRFVAPKTLEVSLNDGGTRTLVGAQVFVNATVRFFDTAHSRWRSMRRRSRPRSATSFPAENRFRGRPQWRLA
jgi:pyruvate/2-oxoglutarate dehydrogenase complex dihydrolipoamide dehydrogenase (E3) component